MTIARESRGGGLGVRFGRGGNLQGVARDAVPRWGRADNGGVRGLREVRHFVFPSSKADFSVCQAKVAHLTRIGNAETPAITARAS